MSYDRYFATSLARLRDEHRYRSFVELERVAGRFPRAVWHAPDGPRDVVVWCSNDYLGMAQHPNVVGAMVETALRMGCLLYTSPSPRDGLLSRMPSSA